MAEWLHTKGAMKDNTARVCGALQGWPLVWGRGTQGLLMIIGSHLYPQVAGLETSNLI